MCSFTMCRSVLRFWLFLFLCMIHVIISARIYWLWYLAVLSLRVEGRSKHLVDAANRSIENNTIIPKSPNSIK